MLGCSLDVDDQKLIMTAMTWKCERIGCYRDEVKKTFYNWIEQVELEAKQTL